MNWQGTLKLQASLVCTRYDTDTVLHSFSVFVTDLMHKGHSHLSYMKCSYFFEASSSPWICCMLMSKGVCLVPVNVVHLSNCYQMPIVFPCMYKTFLALSMHNTHYIWHLGSCKAPFSIICLSTSDNTFIAGSFPCQMPWLLLWPSHTFPLESSCPLLRKHPTTQCLHPSGAMELTYVLVVADDVNWRPLKIKLSARIPFAQKMQTIQNSQNVVIWQDWLHPSSLFGAILRWLPVTRRLAIIAMWLFGTL